MSFRYVDPTAVIDEGAEIGEGARIWHFVHVCAGARIGARCSLGQNVFVAKGVRLGDGVKVQNNVSLYEGVEVEEDVFLGPSCVFTNVNNPRAFLERKTEYRPTRVGRGATIGANATIVCGYDVGRYAFVGAGAVVAHHVGAHALVVGNPARRIGWVCRCGVRLPEGELPLRCPACHDAYAISGEACRLLPAAEAAATASVDPPPAGEAAPVADPRLALPVLPPIPLLDLAAQNGPLLPEIREAFDRVARSGQFILGEEVKSFEQEIALFLGVPHALGVSSGTDAILMALMALEVGPGDEVITTPFSFFATAGCIARVGAKAVFVDIDPVTFNLDVTRVEAAVGPRTKAILPVHLFGQPCAPAALAAIAARRNLPVIEDAAQAIGARAARAPVGALGAIGCFSFFPSKNLGAFGDGGLVTTTDEAQAARLRQLRAHGAESKGVHGLVGGNFRLDAVQAAILRVKLPHLNAWAAARRANAALYTERFAEAGLASELLTPPRAVEVGHVWNQYVIRTSKRDGLRAHLTQRGITTEIYYPVPLHLQRCFASLGHGEGALPEAERASKEVLALPIFPELGEARIGRIVREVVGFFQAG